MAEKFLEVIYEKATVLWQIKEIIEKTRLYEGHIVGMNYNAVLPELIKIYEDYKKYDLNYAKIFGYSLQKISKHKDNLTIIGDKLERTIIPLFEKYLENYRGIKVKNNEEDYEFQSTVSGFLTIKNIKNNTYFHSIVDPMWEARKMAEYIYNPSKHEYCIWGCGLGYLLYQLYLISEKSSNIHLYSADSRMVSYAKQYGVLDWIPKDNLTITITEDILPFLENAEKERVGWHIFTPEFFYIPEDIKNIMIELQLEYKTHYTFQKKIDINFYRNINSGAKMISQFDYSKYGKEYIVVAAGPSLDDTLEFLQNNKQERVVVAVGTVFRKLLNLGIRPDLVVVMDPQERTYRQLEGLEKENIPLLLDIGAYWKFAAKYKGEKYLIPFAHTDNSFRILNEKGCNFWRSGGTVTSLALEVAIQFGAEKIFLLGVDLSYPNGLSHALDTMDRNTLNVEGLKPVESTLGNIVYTDDVFLSYHRWIEDRIRETPHIQYFNLSKTGIKINGAILWKE